MVKPIHKNLRIRTFAAVMLLNFLVILLISIFFQQRSLSFFEREFAATLYEQATANGKNVDAGWQSLYQDAVHAAFDPELQALLQGTEADDSEMVIEPVERCSVEGNTVDLQALDGTRKRSFQIKMRDGKMPTVAASLLGKKLHDELSIDGQAYVVIGLK